ncbi:antibiotic biosynthesis monooxygenase family protein [Amycolatopsis sp. NPDC098790]|uniref:antibiotic biosynthesis monooxygenase family protein n=1 Tax=Amycolatopsis sp. NPDC098790 TaxID=3363939 RepID=UPI0037F7E0A3
MLIVPSAERPDVFAVNVFRVSPENQQPLVECIRNAGDPAGVPGLLSMHLLCSEDGRQVTNFTHWASRAALDAATAENTAIKATRIAIRRFSAGPEPYRVVEVKGA